MNEFKVSFSLGKSIGMVFLFFALFPWVSFGLNEMDSQPWYIFAAFFFLVYVLFAYKSVAVDGQLVLGVFFLLVGVCFSSGVTFFINSNADEFIMMRGVGSYLGFCISFLAFYIYLRVYGFPINVFLLINCVYIIVAIIQSFYYPGFLESFVNYRTTQDRGVPSLAVEPTYFGMLMLLFNFCYLGSKLLNDSMLIKFVFVVNILAIILLAKSAMASLFVLVAIFGCAIKRMSLFYIFCGFLFVIVIFWGFSMFGQDLRIYKLMSYFDQVGFLGLIYKDASVNFRVSSLIFPYFGFVLNGFMPGGFLSFYDLSLSLKSFFDGFFWYGAHTKIMSYWGAFIYELGFFGFFYWAWMFLRAHYHYGVGLFYLTFFFLIINSALPVALPMVGFSFVILMHGISGLGDYRFKG